MVVDMLGFVLHSTECLSAVVRHLHARIHDVDTIKRVRARLELLIVVGSGAAGDGVGSFLPARTAIGAAPEPTFAIVELDHGVDDVRVLG